MRLHPTGGFDNSARGYEHITAVPLAAAMGAEIRDVQVSALTDAQFLEIEDALYRSPAKRRSMWITPTHMASRVWPTRRRKGFSAS